MSDTTATAATTASGTTATPTTPTPAATATKMSIVIINYTIMLQSPTPILNMELSTKRVSLLCFYWLISSLMHHMINKQTKNKYIKNIRF